MRSDSDAARIQLSPLLALLKTRLKGTGPNRIFGTGQTHRNELTVGLDSGGGVGDLQINEKFKYKSGFI